MPQNKLRQLSNPKHRNQQIANLGVIQLKLIYNIQTIIYKSLGRMKQDNSITRFSSTQLTDAKTKIKLYLMKLLSPGPPTKLEKICHLASQTFLKFADNQQFAKEVYSQIQNLIIDKKCYYGLYLMDILLKNHRLFTKSAKKQIERYFQVIYERVAKQPKNSHKIESLKAMARTWGVIYGQKYEQSIRKWIQNHYKDNLNLLEKNQELFRESYEKYKSKSHQNMKIQKLLEEMNEEDNLKKKQNLTLLQALKD